MNHITFFCGHVTIINTKETNFIVTKNYFMTPFYFFFLIIGLSLIILLVRSLITKKKNIPANLFLEALRNENSGHFEEAIVTYENALNEVKKRRFHSVLKNKIVEKLKVLHSAIDYKRGFISPAV